MHSVTRHICTLLLIALAALGAPAFAQDAPQDLALWPNGAPGAARMKLQQTVTTSQGGSLVAAGVMRPTLTIYRPSGPFTKAVLVIPGGGFKFVVTGREGHDVARWLTRNGIAAGVLTYRLPSDHWPQKDKILVEDAQRAIRLLRRETGAAKVGVLGFSAGGAIAVRLDGAASDKAYAAIDDADARSAKPDFLGLGYAPFDARDMAKAPAPAFIFHAADDPKVAVGDSRSAYRAFTRAGAKAELHVFKTGDHGFGLGWPGQETAAWPKLFLDWLQGL